MLNIDGIYKDYISTLETQVSKFKDIYNHPEIIVTELFHPDSNQPYYNHLTRMLRSGGTAYHDLQNELGRVLADYFKNIDSEVEVKVVNPNSYPSRFGVYYLGKELISFNIYTHVFGNMLRDISIESIHKSIENDTVFLNEEANKLKLYQEYNVRPFKCLAKANYSSKKIKRYWIQFRDFVYILFHKKKVKDHFAKRVENILKRIETIEKQISRYHENIEHINEIKEPLELKYKELRLKFLDWGYEEKPTRDQTLY